MNRAARRAVARSLSKALGRNAKAHRPTAGPTLEERLAQLEKENAELRDTVDGLTDRHDRVPGVQPGRKDWYVHVGGERVNINAIPPGEWLKTAQELPEFLFAFALQKNAAPNEGLSEKGIADVVELARRWITACAEQPDDLRLDRLTVPEAEHAVAQIAELNGVTAYLRTWFRSRLQGVAAATRDRAEVRAEAEQPTGDLPN